MAYTECFNCDWEGDSIDLILRDDGNHCPGCDSGNLFEPNCPSAYMTDEEVQAAVKSVDEAAARLERLWIDEGRRPMI